MSGESIEFMNNILLVLGIFFAAGVFGHWICG